MCTILESNRAEAISLSELPEISSMFAALVIVKRRK